MFDFLRNLTKSAEEKRQETIAAYVDGLLNGRSRQQFEQQMAQDDALRVEVEHLLLIKQSLRQLPMREVPRNFILDPAKFSSAPARQPWVQAYPVLRTATAMAAFFFIFAMAAGIFTGFGVNSEPSFAPAADVAQIEAVETTRVVTEVTEPLAYEAEIVAEEEMVEEEMAGDADAEMVEETADEVPPPAEAAAAEAPQDDTGDTAEDGGVAPAPQATAPAPTATASTLPRVASPTPLPDRDPDQFGEGADEANDIVADMLEPAVEDGMESAETTAVLPEETMQDVAVAQPASPLLWLQLGLGVLLFLLVGLTLYARRQR